MSLQSIVPNHYFFFLYLLCALDNMQHQGDSGLCNIKSCSI